MNPIEKISNLRAEIDEIDEHLVTLLLKRFSYTKKIGNIKASNAMDIDNLVREKDIIEHLSNKANHNLKKRRYFSYF